MMVKKLGEVPFTNMKGYDGVTKQIVLGPDDGSDEIIMRYFSVQPGKATPYHSHDFPHLVKIEKGDGIVRNKDGDEHRVHSGDFVFVRENETHNFVNNGSVTFEFICIIPKRGET